MSEWQSDMHAGEARRLVSGHGPLAHLPGVVTHDGLGHITLDQSAFDSLLSLAALEPPPPGHIAFKGDVPCIVFAPVMYPVWPVEVVAAVPGES